MPVRFADGELRLIVPRGTIRRAEVIDGSCSRAGVGSALKNAGATEERTRFLLDPQLSHRERSQETIQLLHVEHFLPLNYDLRSKN